MSYAVNPETDLWQNRYKWLFIGLLFMVLSLLILYFSINANIFYFGALLLAAICWVTLCLNKPFVGFQLLLFEFIVFYPRWQIGVISVAGPGNRGVLAMGDFLWLGFLISLVICYGKRKLCLRASLPLYLWLMIPFNVLAVFLPVLGVMVGDWPLSYAVPGLRHLQWMSFGLAGGLLVSDQGMENYLRGLIKVIVSAGAVHFIYSMIQLSFYLGLLSRRWVYLDDLFTLQNEWSWFFYPRVTGLLVNPNSYGLFCAFLLIVSMLVFIHKPIPKWRLYFWLTFVPAISGLILSASRSALIGLGVALTIIALNYYFTKQIPCRLFGLVVLFILIAVLLIMIWPLIPGDLQGRFARFINVFSAGAEADINALSRVEEWRRLWSLYLNECPLGTLVPPSYALGSAVDSFYVQTTMQGTPLYTLFWLLFMMALLCFAWGNYSKGNLSKTSYSLILTGWTGVLLGGSIGVTAMLNPTLLALFWTMFGAIWAESKRSYTVHPGRYGVVQ